MNLKIGTKVVVWDSFTHTHKFEDPKIHGLEAIVVSLNKGPGKEVGICFKNKLLTINPDTKEEINLGHSCDGILPEGHGWWVRECQLSTKEQYEADQSKEKDTNKERNEVAEIIKDFIK